jgi:GDP-4-dehydro-6-deoxy-D-mannose reductase
MIPINDQFMNKALVTGGCGFVGRHLVSLLEHRGSRVAILAQKGSRQVGSAKLYEADIRDRVAVGFAIEEFRPNDIYHLAAISSADLAWRFPRRTYDVNVFGTLNVLEAAFSLPSQPRVLIVSTAQVYASSAAALIESSPLDPPNPYATSKLMSELLRVQYRPASGKIVVARPFNHTGPGQSSTFVLSSIARQFAEIELGIRQPKLGLGNTHVKRDFTDVRDVVQAYCLLLEKGRPQEIYNVCSGRSWSVKQVIDEFASITGIGVAVESQAEKVRVGEVEEVCGSFAKIQTETGWQPAIRLVVTLKDLLKYWRTKLPLGRDNPGTNRVHSSPPSLASK